METLRLSKFHKNLFGSFSLILLTNQQTDTSETGAPCRGNNHLASPIKHRSPAQWHGALVLLSLRAGSNSFSLFWLQEHTSSPSSVWESESAAGYLQLRRDPQAEARSPPCSRKSAGIRRRSVCSDWPGWPRPLLWAADKSCLFETVPLLMNYNRPCLLTSRTKPDSTK